MSKDKKFAKDESDQGGKKIDEEVDKKDKAEQYLDNWKRAQADFENYKKDQAKMMGEFRKFAIAERDFANSAGVRQF